MGVANNVTPHQPKFLDPPLHDQARRQLFDGGAVDQYPFFNHLTKSRKCGKLNSAWSVSQKRGGGSTKPPNPP